MLYQRNPTKAPNNAEIIDEVHVGRFSIDGSRVISLDSDVIKDRNRILYNGVVVLSLVVNQSGNIMKTPQLTTHGLIEEEEFVDLFEHLMNKIKDDMKEIGKVELKRTS